MLNKIATEYSRDWTMGECKRELGQARGGSGLRLPYLCARLAAWGSLQQRTAGLRRPADPVLAAARRRAPWFWPTPIARALPPVPRQLGPARCGFLKIAALRTQGASWREITARLGVASERFTEWRGDTQKSFRRLLL
jgi:hypothetical protein